MMNARGGRPRLAHRSRMSLKRVAAARSILGSDVGRADSNQGYSPLRNAYLQGKFCGRFETGDFVTRNHRSFRFSNHRFYREVRTDLDCRR